MKNKILLILILPLFVISCRKDEIKPASKDYLIFGHFYGECYGWEECIEIFKLERDQLYEDRNDLYPSSSEFYKGDFRPLSQEKFIVAKDLRYNFPRALWNDSNTRIGNPDDRDQGGLYIEFKHRGKRRFWLLDKDKSKVPADYHGFIDEVNETIKKVRR
jgi:hypothetical protein